MASVIEDAETYQQSTSIVPPFHLETSNDLVPLTNPTTDLTAIRRTSSLVNTVSRGNRALLLYDFPMIYACSV